MLCRSGAGRSRPGRKSWLVLVALGAVAVPATLHWMKPAEPAAPASSEPGPTHPPSGVPHMVGLTAPAAPIGAASVRTAQPVSTAQAVAPASDRAPAAEDQQLGAPHVPPPASDRGPPPEPPRAPVDPVPAAPDNPHDFDLPR